MLILKKGNFEAPLRAHANDQGPSSLDAYGTTGAALQTKS
jgi:hypothetical protein